MRNFATYIVALLLCVGCFNDEEFNTQIVFQPTFQAVDGDDYQHLPGVVGYAFDVESADVEILDYAMAASGFVADIGSGEVIAPFAVTSAYLDNEEWADVAQSMQVAREDVFLLVVDTANESYAYRDYTVGINLSTTYITMAFRPWKEGSVTQSSWTYVYPEIIIDEGIEGGEE